MNREIIMTEQENELVHWAISGEIQGTPVAPNLPLLADKYYRVKVYEKLKIGLLAVLSAVLACFHEFVLPAKTDSVFNLCGILGLIGACILYYGYKTKPMLKIIQKYPNATRAGRRALWQADQDFDLDLLKKVRPSMYDKILLANLMYKQRKVVNVFEKHRHAQPNYFELNYVEHLFNNLFFQVKGTDADNAKKDLEALYLTSLQEIEPEIDVIIKDDVERLDSLKQLQESDKKLYEK